MLGEFSDAAQFALVLLFLLDAVLDFLLALLVSLFTGFGFALQLLEVSFFLAFLLLGELVGLLGRCRLG